MTRTATVTAVHMRYATTLPFPAITICNMAPGVPLHTTWCGSYLTEQHVQCRPFVPAGLPHCLTFNNHLNGTVYTAEKTGLADTLMVALRIHRDQYPPSARFLGVHVDLHPQCSHEHGDCPEELSNVLIASPGTPKFFHMRRLTLQYLNGSTQTQVRVLHPLSRDSIQCHLLML